MFICDKYAVIVALMSGSKLGSYLETDGCINNCCLSWFKDLEFNSRGQN